MTTPAPLDPAALIPQRIVCLTAEMAEVLYRLGAEHRVVGVTGFAPPAPSGEKKPVVCAFTSVQYDRIDALQPDLVIGFSDLQAEAISELARRGHPVHLTNQRSLAEVLQTILTLGRLVGCEAAACRLVTNLHQCLETARRETAGWARRPQVYFEEWDEPPITGIRWMSELIEAAGGDDLFADLSRRRTAPERIVEAGEVAAGGPEIILASWCGKRVRFEAVRQRPGWAKLPAVRDDELHALEGACCLQPGPSLFEQGLPRLQAIFGQWHQARSR